jgi:Na+-transporting methylmalonyl-CoA/oxaloacetate decarboxylase gamma subunit
MDTGVIIAIVVAVLLILAVVAFLLPRMRRKAQLQKRERELQQRRERVADEHRSEAQERERQASQAEQRARIAAKEAEAERAQAELHQERAGLHEKGMADDELIGDHERDKFRGTSAMAGSHDRDGDGVDDRREAITGDGSRDDYDRGRHDQALEDQDRPARFNRDVAAESPREQQRR